jgi:amidase
MSAARTTLPFTLAALHRAAPLRRRASALLCALVIGHSSLATSVELRAAQFDLATATIADVNAAFAKGALTSEKLTALYLARITAYDQQGPILNTVITLNPKALDEAKALDAERKAGKVRGPLHGIPIVLKDNFDTYDLPTTAASLLLKGSIPPDDAFTVKKLRAAGAVILAKVNLSEFAGGGGSVGPGAPNGFSSMGGQTRNPHDPARGPGGSSGGTGSAIAAVFGQFGLGTDTGGSIRWPSSLNGIVGLKPTHGLLSRDGIVPLALTFDTGGPMARSVYDIAVSLNIMTGVDPADDATKKSAGKIEKDYTKFLKTGSLKGARIGLARDFMGRDPETDRVTEAAAAKLKALGATVVDVRYPDYLLQSRMTLLRMIMRDDFKTQIAEYLATLKPGYPRNVAELAAKAADPATKYTNPSKRDGLKLTEETALELTDPVYLAAKNEGLALFRHGILALFEKHKLDAIVYPTWPAPAQPIVDGPGTAGLAAAATMIANLTGFPDLIVPAGMSKDGLPITISFFGPAFSEPKLLSYGYDFEQATKALVLPKTTPALPGDKFDY